MWRYVIFGLLTACLAVRVCAFNLMEIPQNELVGGSDLILVGTVTAVETAADLPNFIAGQATLKVDRLIKGTAPASVVAHYPAQGGAIAPLQIGQQALFFLQRGPGGYVLTTVNQPIQPVAQADDFARRVAEFPFVVELVPPVGPFYIGQPTPVTMKITNNSTVEVPAITGTVDGYFFSTRMYDAAGTPPITSMPLPVAAAAAPWTPLLPGTTRTITVSVQAVEPASWKFLTPDTYLQTPIALRARVFLAPVDPHAPRDLTLRSPGVASAWVNTIMGYPLPQEATVR